ncbi:hypothetical protein G7K_0026-t1 [Saitoella complicata NRRL Y-17804]|uniref:Uncharacterized protein n=1 Tax=Saitoella complicata (strain BCRC 22490 / CBS 7301 / JCM 7358 / NBRC 10748 / NRRL Y-17804) TaxID=698492 RepID=A0A0E9N7G7_SAICN|nr:hypothetical protein G7K_0026-t1 [Saitoella complicata NRRL Y-17804]
MVSFARSNSCPANIQLLALLASTYVASPIDSIVQCSSLSLLLLSLGFWVSCCLYRRRRPRSRRRRRCGRYDLRLLHRCILHHDIYHRLH